MAQKVTIETRNGGALFIINTAKANGQSDAVPINAAEALAHEKVVSAIIAKAKNGATLRAALQSMLGEIFADKNLQGYKGKSDPKTGKVAQNLKQAAQDAEKSYFKLLLNKGELKSVIKPDSDNSDDDFQSFVGEVLNDNNYKNIRSLVLRYFAFCGESCVTKSKHLVPPPVMMERVKAMLEITPPDNSIAGMLTRVQEALAMEKDLKSDVIRRAFPVARDILATLQGQINRLNEIATAAAQELPPTDVNVADAAARVVKDAKAKVQEAQPA